MKEHLEPLLALLLLIFIIIPIAFPTLVIVAIYRWTIIKFNKGRAEPIEGLDIAFIADNFHTQPKGGTSFIWILEGELDPDQVLQRLTKALQEDEAKYDYSRLKTLYPASWMGVPFWGQLNEGKWRMEDHIKLITPKFNGSDRELNEILVEWMRSGFPEQRPLWEVMVIPSLILGKKIS